jgi:hypothetical protein
MRWRPAGLVPARRGLLRVAGRGEKVEVAIAMAKSEAKGRPAVAVWGRRRAEQERKRIERRG